MMDDKILSKIIKFRNDRNWKQFHTVKDLCLGIGIEVSELQELFLWKNDREINNMIKEDSEEIGDEIADIYIFLSYLAHDLNIDLRQAVLNKLEKNENKYPVSKSKNSKLKYNQL